MDGKICNYGNLQYYVKRATHVRLSDAVIALTSAHSSCCALQAGRVLALDICKLLWCSAGGTTFRP